MDPEGAADVDATFEHVQDEFMNALQDGTFGGNATSGQAMIGSDEYNWNFNLEEKLNFPSLICF